jgi:maltooligosyltrehalose trehalohydrolase
MSGDAHAGAADAHAGADAGAGAGADAGAGAGAGAGADAGARRARFGASGAVPEDGATTFRVWSPVARRVQVRLFADGERASVDAELEDLGGGFFAARREDVAPGSLYKFVVDGRELPDPYARYLPYGVHGPAEVIERKRAEPFRAAPPLEQYVIYELHVGAFTPEGTYAAAMQHLEHLVDLGVTAVELMPLASFPGRRGWGYDGVAHFAPFAPYGRPDDLRELIARAHAAGLAVLLDAVYNHFGPRGNYLGAYATAYFGAQGDNPWGDAPNFGEPAMREYVLSNARMWFDEYGFDGLRLDATQTLRDASPVHILRELRDLAASYTPAKTLIAEDDRNDPSLVRETGLDAIWADDFHHQMHVVLTGERDGYYAAFKASTHALARTIARGWLYEGERYAPWRRARGRPASGLSPKRFVYCVQNHDQIGNRALGDRLRADGGVEALRAATIVLLFLPMTPLLFMGQEWASTSPFLFFTDHDDEYGEAVAKGRREEFRDFVAFARDDAVARIPDPQADGTFERSKLVWEEARWAPHHGMHEAVRAMIRLRKEDAVLREPGTRAQLRANAKGRVLVVERSAAAGRRVLVANLSAHTQSAAPMPDGGTPLFAVGDIGPGRLGPFAVAVWRA